MIRLLALFAALNLNPCFETEGDALPGWQVRGAARHIRDAEGISCVLAEEGSVRSSLFQVAPGSVIEVTLKGCGPKYLRKRRKVWTAVAFFATEAEAKAPGAQWKLARPKLEVSTAHVSEKSETYPVPAGARWCRLTVRGGTVYGCRAEVKK